MSVNQIVTRFPTTPIVDPYSTSTTSTVGSSASTYPAPTSTGRPVCGGRSQFDGTVNDNYLILCETPLPGFDITTIAAVDLADCIEECSSMRPENGMQCVAVEFNPVSLKRLWRLPLLTSVDRFGRLV